MSVYDDDERHADSVPNPALTDNGAFNLNVTHAQIRSLTDDQLAEALAAPILRDEPLPEGALREDAGDSMDTAHRWVRQDHADQISMDRNNLTLWALGKHQMDLATVRETILRLDQNLQQVDL